jgi:single-strand selective monofunctional uracil DNA glycosylase
MSTSALITAARTMQKDLSRLRFATPVTHVYDPLDYAWEMHSAYLKQMGDGHKRVVFLGMNPGPFGMAQTGVPFGEIAAVRDWLGLEGRVGKPSNEHPKRPITGFACLRSEVSGRRLWGLFKARFTTPAHFAQEHFVANYCPLVFMESSGKNRTPGQLPGHEALSVREICDSHLRSLVAILAPTIVVGVGRYAASRAQEVLAGKKVAVACIPHPSPANPAANKDWAGAAQTALVDQGIWRRRATALK